MKVQAAKMAVSPHVQVPLGSGIAAMIDVPERNRYPSLAPHQTGELGRNAEVTVERFKVWPYQS